MSENEGYISGINTLQLGKQLVELGGGRKYKEQLINYDVGIIIKIKLNDYVKQNDTLFEVYSEGTLPNQIKENILNSISFSKRKKYNIKNIYKIIN